MHRPFCIDPSFRTIRLPMVGPTLKNLVGQAATEQVDLGAGERIVIFATSVDNTGTGALVLGFEYDDGTVGELPFCNALAGHAEMAFILPKHVVRLHFEPNLGTFAYAWWRGSEEPQNTPSFERDGGPPCDPP